MTYRSEYSNPRKHRRAFFCERCHAWRYIVDVQEGDLLVWVFNSLNPTDTLASDFGIEAKPEGQKTISPLDT